MPTGRIKYYNLDKGFGFIAQDNSEVDVFLHSSAIKNADYEELRVGQRVKYIVVEGDRGLVAKNVEILLTPTERRWLRQGKTIIPRGYSGFPNQNQDQIYKGEDHYADKSTNSKTDIGKKFTQEATGDDVKTIQKDALSDLKDVPSRQLSFGDLYILKQINYETPMYFVLYNDNELPAIVLEMTLSSLTLRCNGKEKGVQKKEIKYCYKDEDAENINRMLKYDEDIKSQQLKPVGSIDQVYHIDSDTMRKSRQDGKPIKVTLREGEVFEGTVDWISPYEIKLVLSDGAKVVIFRHAICSLIVIDEENQNGNSSQ